MTQGGGVDRRQVMLGLAGAGTVLASAEESQAAAVLASGQTRDPFLVRSSDGTMIAGEAQGDPAAPEILFIHGVRQSRLSWDKQFSDKALAGYRLVRFDMRGHGDSGKPTALNAYSELDRWAEDVAAVIEATQLRKPAIVGWSLGGFVTGGYLRKFGADRVAGLSLVDAVIQLSPDLLTPLAEKFAEATLSHDLSVRTAATADFLRACFHKQPAPADLERLMVVNGMAVRAMAEGFMQASVFDVEPLFKSFAGPILLSHGVHDRLVRVAMSQSLKAQRPDAILSLYKDCGHSPFYENPRRFNQELAAFVDGIARRAK